jgi:hypothetical protein
LLFIVAARLASQIRESGPSQTGHEDNLDVAPTAPMTPTTLSPAHSAPNGLAN